MKRLLPLALMLLTGCEPDGKSADGYRFEQAEFTRSEISLRVVEHGSVAELRAAARREGAKVEPGRELMAFGIIEGGRCTIHIVDPAKDYAPEWIGHEVTHCIKGRWHR